MNGTVTEIKRNGKVEATVTAPVVDLPDGTPFCVYRTDPVMKTETIVAMAVASHMRAPGKRAMMPNTFNLTPSPGWTLDDVRVGDLVRLASAPAGRLARNSPQP